MLVTVHATNGQKHQIPFKRLIVCNLQQKEKNSKTAFHTFFDRTENLPGVKTPRGVEMPLYSQLGVTKSRVRWSPHVYIADVIPPRTAFPAYYEVFHNQNLITKYSNQAYGFGDIIKRRNHFKLVIPVLAVRET